MTSAGRKSELSESVKRLCGLLKSESKNFGKLKRRRLRVRSYSCRRHFVTLRVTSRWLKTV
jgi:hypothetical protein